MGFRVLVVEDEADLAELVAVTLRGAGHTVTVANTGAAAIARFDTKRPISSCST